MGIDLYLNQPVTGITYCMGDAIVECDGIEIETNYSGRPNTFKFYSDKIELQKILYQLELFSHTS